MRHERPKAISRIPGVNGETSIPKCHCCSNLCTRSGPLGHIDRSFQLWKTAKLHKTPSRPDNRQVCDFILNANASFGTSNASTALRPILTRRRIFAWKYLGTARETKVTAVPSTTSVRAGAKHSTEKVIFTLKLLPGSQHPSWPLTRR